jgi:hypothetical protein
MAIQEFLFGGSEGKGKGRGTGKKVGMLVFTLLWISASSVFLIADFAAGELFQCPILPGSVIDGVVWGVKRLVG